MIIELTEYNWNQSIKENSKYQYLLNILHDSYGLNKDILYNLMELHLFSYISNTKVSYEKGKVIYSIPEEAKLNNNYENSPIYTFASYPLFDKEFQVKNRKRFFILSSNNNELKSLLELELTYSNFNLYYLLEFNKSFLIPYDINLLTESEKDQLEASIMRQQGLLEEDYIDTVYNEIHYFNFDLNVCNHQNAKDTHIEIKKQMQINYDLYSSMLEQFKEENKSFFERALTEIQIENF